MAVNYTGGSTSTGTTQTAVMIGEICSRMDGAEGATVVVTMEPGTATEPGGSVGRSATVTVSRPATSLSGFYGPLFDGKTLRSSVETRLEVEASWATASGTCS